MEAERVCDWQTEALCAWIQRKIGAGVTADEAVRRLRRDRTEYGLGDPTTEEVVFVRTYMNHQRTQRLGDPTIDVRARRLAVDAVRSLNGES